MSDRFTGISQYSGKPTAAVIHYNKSESETHSVCQTARYAGDLHSWQVVDSFSPALFHVLSPWSAPALSPASPWFTWQHHHHHHQQQQQLWLILTRVWVIQDTCQWVNNDRCLPTKILTLNIGVITHLENLEMSEILIWSRPWVPFCVLLLLFERAWLCSVNCVDWASSFGEPVMLVGLFLTTLVSALTCLLARSSRWVPMCSSSLLCSGFHTRMGLVSSTEL